MDLYDPFLDFAAFGAARGFGAALGPAFFGVFAAATLLAFFLNGLLSTPSDWRLRFGPFLDAGTERGVSMRIGSSSLGTSAGAGPFRSTGGVGTGHKVSVGPLQAGHGDLVDEVDEHFKIDDCYELFCRAWHYTLFRLQRLIEDYLPGGL